jgi:hypothetical protein
MVGTLWHAKAAAGWLHPIMELEFLLVSIGIVLSWTAAALIYLGALLEGAWIVYVGPILICFSALSSTAPMLIQWATRVLAIAIKIAVLYSCSPSAWASHKPGVNNSPKTAPLSARTCGGSY